MRFKKISNQFSFLEPWAISGRASCHGEKMIIGRKILNLIQINPLLDLLRKLGSVEFRDYFGLFSIFFSGGNIDKGILPPEKKSKIGQNNPEIQRTLNYARGLFRFLLLLAPLFLFSSPTSLSSLYATLDPTSVAEHFSFYELYPNTPEGKKALAHAWDLLSGGQEDPELVMPAIDISPLLSIVTRDSSEIPVLEKDQLKVIANLGKHLGNRKLKGFGLSDLQEIIALPSSEIDLARSLLVAELGSDPETLEKIASYEANLDLMALQILARLPHNATPIQQIKAINHYIFSEMGFRFPPHSLHAKDIDVYTFLPSVLDSRKGVCLGVSILYQAIAQRLNLTLEAVTPPGHIFVRYVDSDGNITNIETTARGIDVPTEHYLGLEVKSLQQRTMKEVVGLAFMNQAAVKWHKEDVATAISLYEKGKNFLPDDYLLQMFLGFNYLFAGRMEEGKALLKNIRGKAPDHVLTSDTLLEDYLDGKVDVEGIQAVFSEVNETRESILEKQQKLQEITKKYPQFRQGIFHLAVTWMQLGREKEALPLLEKYISIYPQDPTVNYYIAAISMQRYNYNQAWKYLQNAISLLQKKDHYPRALKNLKKELERQCPNPL